jgi:hypothetical protein
VIFRAEHATEETFDDVAHGFQRWTARMHVSAEVLFSLTTLSIFWSSPGANSTSIRSVRGSAFGSEVH